MNYFCVMKEKCGCCTSGAITSEKDLPNFIEKLEKKGLKIESKEVISDQLYNYIKSIANNFTQRPDTKELIDKLKKLRESLGLDDKKQEEAMNYAKEAFEKEFNVEIPDEFLKSINELIK
jgi:hypothetical protein